MTHISGADFALKLIIRMDVHAQGLCGEFLRASNERRQVIAAYLAQKPPAEADMTRVGHFLRSASHRALLKAAYGDTPQGMRGALRRSGNAIHGQHFYALLDQLLTRPVHRQIARTIARLDELNHARLLITRLLPEEICRGNVVESIGEVRKADDVATAFRLLASRDVDAEALACAIRKVRSPEELGRLWQRWMAKAICPPHPIPSSSDYHPLQTGEALNGMALRYRNCSRRYLPTFLKGEDAFAEFTHEAGSAVVHLQQTDTGWKLDGIYGRHNANPRPDLRESVHVYLARHGVEIPERAHTKGSEWDSLRRLTRESMFDFELD